MLTKIYFGVFSGVEMVRRNNGELKNMVVLRDVMDIEKRPAKSKVWLPVTSNVMDILPLLQDGVPIIFRLERLDMQHPPVLECFWEVPYWYERVPIENWNSILDELQKKKEHQP
jgi:hypothetical protein